MQAYTLHRPGTGGEKLVPSTGGGSVPAADRSTRFLAAHGYALEQVERDSAFDLRGPFDLVERMLTEATAVAGPEYRPTPDIDETLGFVPVSYAGAWQKALVPAS